MEPADSPVLSGGAPGPHKIQGIGAGFIPKNYNGSVVDEVLQVSNDNAILFSAPVGTTGKVCSWVFRRAQQPMQPHNWRYFSRNKGKNIVALLPDTGERYLSTLLYAFEEYLLEKSPNLPKGRL